MFQAVTAVTIAGALVFGVLRALQEILQGPLGKQPHIGEQRAPGLLLMLNVTLLVMLPVAGLLTDSLGVEGVLLAGSLLTAGGLVLLAVGKTHRAPRGAVFLAGAGTACLGTTATVLMPAAFFDGHPAAALNLGYAFVGLGMVAAPALAGLLTEHLVFRRAVGVLALVALVPAVLAAFTEMAAYPARENPLSPVAVLSDPVLWLACLMFWLYTPIEAALDVWAAPYLVELGDRERRATRWLAGFWLVLLGSRLATAFLFHHGTLSQGFEPWLVVILALAGAVVLGNLAGTTSLGSARWALLLVGAVLGPLFPTLVGLLFDRYGTGQRGTAFGVVFAVGATANFVFVPLLAASVRRTNSVRTAIRVPIVIALALGVFMLALGLALPLL